MEKKYYHGTSTGKGIKIARTGELRSPWEQEIQYLITQKRKKPDDCLWQEIFPEKNLEEAALYYASSGYSEREIEPRVKCISITPTFSNALGHAQRYENDDGGIVLTIRFQEDYVNAVKMPFSSAEAIFIPRRLSIVTLSDVHVGAAAENRLPSIQNEFVKYNPLIQTY